MKIIFYFIPVKILRMFFFLFFTGIFFVSCGLDEIISLDAPNITNNKPLYSSTDFQNWYFDFFVKNTGQPDSFIGTDIFYRIYSNSSDLESQRSDILSVNENDTTNLSAKRMIENYNYKPLGAFPIQSESVLLPKSGDNYQVKIRLKSHKGSENYNGEGKEKFVSCIKIGVEYKNFVPFRTGSAKSFDFFDDDDNDLGKKRDVIPSKDDIEGDISVYSSQNSDTYYVQLFAVSVGFDESTLENTYSKVLDLGSVPIKKNQ